MSVRSRPIDTRRRAPVIEDGDHPVAAPRSRSRIVGFFALLIGVPFWLEAARFTRDGWIVFVDWLCARFGVPWQVPPLDWRVGIVLLILFGIGYSYVEIVKLPVRLPADWRKDFLSFDKWRIEQRWEAWVVWLVLIVSDVATTYVGARRPDPSGLAIMRDIAASSGALALYAILLTFIPDRLARFGWRSFWRG